MIGPIVTTAAADKSPHTSAGTTASSTLRDGSDHESRAARRYRLARWGTLTSIGSRGLSMLLLLLGVRLTIDYMGPARFGLWATFSSMAAMLSLLDLGVGNALVNRVAQAATDDDPHALRRVVSGGAALLAMLALVSTTLLSFFAWVLPWGILFKLPDGAAALEARSAAVVFALLFGVNLATSGMLRILVGLQRSFEANLLSGIATALACAALWWTARAEAGVPLLLAATFGVQTLGGLAAALVLLRRGQLVPGQAWSAMRLERSHLLGTGALFVLLQVGTMLGWGSDSVLLALLRGAGEVAVYAVALRLFQFASQPFAMLNAPLWASYADARARRDISFIRTTLKRSFLISLGGSTFLSAGLCVFGPRLIFLWTHGALAVSTTILVLIAIWTVIEASGNALGVYLNGCGIVREQVAVVLLFCALVLPLKLWLGSEFGIPGLLCAAIGAYGLVIIGLYGFVFRSRLLAPIRELP